MVQTAHGWELEIERGPNWLFVRPHDAESNAAADPDDIQPLGEVVWALLEQNFAHRLVLELDLIKRLDERLIHELIWLEKRIHADGGLMRICGLKPGCQKALAKRRLDGHFPAHANRTEAVMCGSRLLPR